MWRTMSAMLALIQLGCAGLGSERAGPPALAAISFLGEAPGDDAPAAVRLAPLDVESDDEAIETDDAGSAMATIGTVLLKTAGESPTGSEAPVVNQEPETEDTRGDAPDSNRLRVSATSDLQPVPPALASEAALSLEAVIESVYQAYPLLEASILARNVAAGEQVEALGEFDLKLAGAVESGPAGYYETYRNNIGVYQPLFPGGSAFAGYRIGRGSFQPWYRERQTNSGGELKAGVLLPLCRDLQIDERRAELWKAGLERQLVEPQIQADLIAFVQDASYAYWNWVAAGMKVRIAERVLVLAEDRSERIRRQVEENLLDPPEYTNNLLLIAERRGKLADATRKLQQSAVKLSLYYRDANGEPLIPANEALAGFPQPEPVDPDDVSADAQRAVQQRPELRIYNFLQRQLDVDYAQARNLCRPQIDGVIAGSQDLGDPTSSKDDKSQFELEASVFVEMPVQRRKARGKMQAIAGKVSQLNAKRRMTEDKIVADVQAVYAAQTAALEQVRQAQAAVQYAEDLAQRERRNFEEGLSDLLKVTLREQYAAEAAEKAADALLLYYIARADYRAALATDRP